ncbi:hypothetical protein SCORR_v1c05870 [Spiroplasma corruscae]|uniref:Uncharacterized protein n=1 Tax=Spiroplasma corruscae TaxID=216934 RepID=A0A222EPC2_9MOLU|nr:hypothetical protein [Spiroplasma corruscae]ASP28359.1 hypothetical protein SCORR_v1c05870 [Spiroplasma corruscae]
MNIKVTESEKIFKDSLSPIRISYGSNLEVDYNKNVINLKIDSYSESNIINATIDNNNFIVNLIANEVGETINDFSLSNTLKESLLVIVYKDDAKFDINLSKNELILNIIDGVKSKEIVKYNNQVIDLKLKTNSIFIKVIINESIITIEAVKDGSDTLEFMHLMVLNQNIWKLL